MHTDCAELRPAKSLELIPTPASRAARAPTMIRAVWNLLSEDQIFSHPFFVHLLFDLFDKKWVKSSTLFPPKN